MQEEQPLSIGQVLDRGFAVYRKSLVGVLPLTFTAALLPVIPRLFLSPEAMVQGNKVNGGQFGLYFLLIMLLSLAATALWVGVIRKQDDVASGSNTLSTLQAVTGGLRYFLPAIGVGFLYGLVICVGFLLLIVPGIIFSVSLGFALFALILDGVGIMGSLERSRTLVRGHWWRAATILTVALLIYLAIYVGIMTVVAVALPFANVMSVSTGNAAPNTLGTLVVSLVMTLSNSVLLPMVYAMALVAYRDLRVRKTGGDLAARIAAAA